jgi:hypothetical protein
MKYKLISKIFIIIILISSNIFLFNKLKEKQSLINNNTQQEQEKQTKEEIKQENNTVENSNNTIKYLDDENVSVVGLSAFNPNLQKFIKYYMKQKYNYNSISEKKNLENFYSEDLKKLYLENEKGKESHPKYDEKSALRDNMSININTIKNNTYLITVIFKKDVIFINKGSGQNMIENQDDFYINTYIVTIDKNRYIIQKEEEKLLKNINAGG